MSPLCLLAALLLAWCALAPGNVHVQTRPQVPFVQPTTGATP